MLASFKKLVPEPIKSAYHYFQALLGALIFLFPAGKLKVIGVTGTDGKTTTVHLVYHILNSAQEKVSMVSTVEAKIAQTAIDTGFHVTTPDPIKVQGLLKKMANSGSEYAVVEVTSHGLAQGRVAFVKFFAGIITNITHEHLDYHGSYENYLEAKAKLLNGVNLRVLNADDKYFEKLKGRGGGQLISYGIKNSADYVAKSIKLGKIGSEFEVHFEEKKQKRSSRVRTRLVGEFNVYNILAAFALTSNLGIATEQIISAISTFESVVGRMQSVDLGQDFDVIVDFAHTPIALENALRTLRSFTKGKLIAVFGSAGERDVGKRSMMGKVATQLADVSIFTAEDPRKENVNKIIEKIAQGALNEGGIPERTFWKIADRTEAITTAIGSLASGGDVVAIFGKGHERSLNIGGKEYPWSDEQVVRNALKKKLEKKSSYSTHQNYGK